MAQIQQAITGPSTIAKPVSHENVQKLYVCMYMLSLRHRHLPFPLHRSESESEILCPADGEICHSSDIILQKQKHITIRGTIAKTSNKIKKGRNMVLISLLRCLLVVQPLQFASSSLFLIPSNHAYIVQITFGFPCCSSW